MDFVAHASDRRALADATQALSDVTGSPSIERWNDDPLRTRVDGESRRLSARRTLAA